ncbi:MAG TPA: mechanosensitive ion channel domain-containing protein [Gemmatimonadaceae bacterium]|jgi:small-conductance mechanosensitive channel
MPMQSFAALQGLQVFGVRLAGFNPATGRKVLLTLGFVAVLMGASYLLRLVLRLVLGHVQEGRAAFWSRQGTQIVTALLLSLGLASIWFDDPARLGSFLGLLAAGVAIALQRVVTAFAAYLIVLRGRVYTVGDRITMGGVRGDVVALGFMQTTVMEMGEPPAVQGAEPPVWVHSRQYTGRLVRVTNDRIFDSPVYNYTREFPYLWEEIRLPVKYGADRRRAEEILLDAARRHTADVVAEATPALQRLRDRFTFKGEAGLDPAVYYRLTDNWLELTVRFVCREHGVRRLKDAISRDILEALEGAGLEVASATYEIVGLPPLELRQLPTTPPVGGPAS